MEISDEDYMFQNLPVSIKNLDEHIDYTISRAYTYDPGSLQKQCNSYFDKDFAKCSKFKGINI